MDVPPVIRCDVGGVDAVSLNRVDDVHYLFDLRPTVGAEKDFAARIDQRHGLVAFAGGDGAQNVDAGNDRAVIIRSPSGEGEDRAGIEADDTVMTVDALFFGDPAKTYPMLDTFLAPRKMSQRAGRECACLHRPILRLKGRRVNVPPQPRFSASCVRKNPRDSELAMLGALITERIRLVKPGFGPR
ncbi:hypothetical protein D3C87_1188980 [compost metagenome]